MTEVDNVEWVFGTIVCKIQGKHNLCKISIYFEVTIIFRSSETVEATPYFTPLSKFSKTFLPVQMESVLIFLIHGCRQMGLRCCG